MSELTPAHPCDEKRFPLGLDADAYLNAALELLKKEYPWATRAMFREDAHYRIVKDPNSEGGYAFAVCYGRRARSRDLELLNDCETGDDFIRYICDDNRYNIESANEISETYQVRFNLPEGACNGWNLERYEFRRHATGDFSAFVQAGDRTAGASRVFFIPRDYFGGSFDEFLDRYCELVPGDYFGLCREDFLRDPGVKAFLGFD